MIIKAGLISGSILLPFIMTISQRHLSRIDTLYTILMVLSVIVFTDIAALSIYQIIQDNTVFMTAIHAIFLKPTFLTASAYIGVYTIYRLLLLFVNEWHKET